MSEQWLYDRHPVMARANPLLFLLLLISIVGIIGILVWWVKCKSERLAISDSEILLERGLLSKQRTQLWLASIRTVRVTQTMWQRLFNVGNIEVFSAGDYAEIAIRNMPDPNRARALVAARGGANPASLAQEEE